MEIATLPDITAETPHDKVIEFSPEAVRAAYAEMGINLLVFSKFLAEKVATTSAPLVNKNEADAITEPLSLTPAQTGEDSARAGEHSLDAVRAEVANRSAQATKEPLPQDVNKPIIEPALTK